MLLTAGTALTSSLILSSLPLSQYLYLRMFVSNFLLSDLGRKYLTDFDVIWQAGPSLALVVRLRKLAIHFFLIPTAAGKNLQNRYYTSKH